MVRLRSEVYVRPYRELIVVLLTCACSASTGGKDQGVTTDDTGGSGSDDTGGSNGDDTASADDNPAPLDECPATLAPQTICADVGGYGVTLFSIWQARANVVDSRTDEPTGEQDTVSLQLSGQTNGGLEGGSFTCGVDNVFLYFGLRAGSPDYALWTAGSERGSCTMSYETEGHIDLEAHGVFEGVLELTQGKGVSERTIAGAFQLHGEE